MSAIVDQPSVSTCGDANPDQAVFDRWAETYDEQTNPFLTLEHRVVSGLLPSLAGKDVLDAGCGTGRMLRLLKSKKPRTLLGVDQSPEMLHRAASIEGVSLRLGNCLDLPVDEGCTDFVLCSFVLSYLQDLQGFADEIARATRSGATVLITDMHPVTEAELNWKRSFRSKDGVVSVVSARWGIQQVVAEFEGRGFQRQIQLELPFSSPEGKAFVTSNRSKDYDNFQGRPAIYVLAFKRCDAAKIEASPKSIFRNARVAVSAWDSAHVDLTTGDGRIETMCEASLLADQGLTNPMDLQGLLVFPGLINAHDHLEFGLFPRLGNGPYGNAQDWADDIHVRDVETIERYRRIPREVSVCWGLLRNLLSGVTTVCHHNPITDHMKQKDLPVKVVDQFGWAHSLAYDPDLLRKAMASDAASPFIFHAAEGVDDRARGEMTQLIEGDGLRQNSVLVHGLALTPNQIRTLNQRGASLISCPSSNQFLFDCEMDTLTLECVDRLALGSDSPLTATGDLLDEIRHASARGTKWERLYQAVTTSAASILRLKGGEGTLAPGGVADFIVMADRGLSPAQTLCESSWRDIELVVRGGRIVLASRLMFSRLHDSLRQRLECVVVEGLNRFIDAPLDAMFDGAIPVIDGCDVILAGKRVCHGRDA